MKRVAALGLLFLAAACRGEAPRSSADAELDHLVDSLVPVVERATGLPFKRRPRATMVTREQARAYISHNLEREFGAGRGKHIESTYRLLGLIPDTLDLGRVMLAVLGEQVAGYYDPDSAAFFGVDGTTPQVLRLTVAHELVHALQHDHLPLDSIVRDLSNADRALAAHSVLEGQATLAMFRMTPEIGEQVLDQAFWDLVREQATGQMRSMPQLATAPRILREAVVFPYFSGAEFMRWWTLEHPADGPPFGSQLPSSSEAILTPDRAAAGDRPWAVTLTGGDVPAFTDVLGAMELRILFAEAQGRELLMDAAVLGWGGDRFGLYETPAGDALVWVAVFDTPIARDGAVRMLADWPRSRAGYRRTLVPIEVSGRPGLRLVVAPEGWVRWTSLPAATATEE